VADVLITGAGGFIGAELVRVFLAAGHRVRAGDLAGVDLSALVALGAEPVPCDVTDADGLREAARDAEVVVHNAGVFDLGADPERLWAVNAGGSRLAAEAAAAGGARRFVQVSSTAVYGRGVRDAREDAPKRPAHDYDCSKWAGEQHAVATCARHDLPCAVVRPTLVYGPGGRYGLARTLALFAVRAHRGHRRLRAAPGGPLSHHVHVTDLARATELVATSRRSPGGAFNVADDAPIRAGELVRALAGALGLEVVSPGVPWGLVRGLRGVVLPLARRLLEGQQGKLDHLWARLVEEEGLEPALTSRIDPDWLEYLFASHTYSTRRLRDLGFSCRHPDPGAGLAETVAWYRERRWLP